MSESIATRICAVLLAAMGMLGLHYGVEYSGWVLLVGLLVALW